MRKTEIIKLVEAKLKEFERVALSEGTDITSPDFRDVLSKLKEAELKAYGISMAEYNRITTVKKKEKAIENKGEKGEKGDGIKGDTGSKGDKGESIIGPKGDKGDIVIGPKGPKGDEGDKGDSIVGPRGPKGDTPNLKKELKALKKYIDKQYPTFDNYTDLLLLLEKIFKRKIDLVIEKDLHPEFYYVKKEAKYVRL